MAECLQYPDFSCVVLYRYVYFFYSYGNIITIILGKPWQWIWLPWPIMFLLLKISNLLSVSFKLLVQPVHLLWMNDIYSAIFTDWCEQMPCSCCVVMCGTLFVMYGNLVFYSVFANDKRNEMDLYDVLRLLFLFDFLERVRY